MKIDALMVSFKEDGVMVLVRSMAALPMRRVFDSSVSALESVRLDPASLGAPDPAPDPQRKVELAPLRLKGMPASHRGRAGLVVARTIAQAMAFLLDRFEPEGDGQPDATIREIRARPGTRHGRLRDLEEVLLKREIGEIDQFHVTHRRPPFRRPRFVWTAESFERNFDLLLARRGGVYLPALERNFPGEDLPRPVAVVERSRVVGRHEVPQWNVLSPRQVDGTLVAHGCVDGRWFRGPLSRVDARILEAFEDHGRLVNLAEGDPLAGEAMQARFLVQVPRGAAPRPARVADVPPVAAGEPGVYLIDSRCSVVLDPDLPVIDDPAEAWAVLLRTSCGIFLPDAPPATPPRSFRALAGGFVVGCAPAPLARRRSS